MRHRRVLDRFLRILGIDSNTTLRRTVNLRTFIPGGCRFEITTPIEAFRVEQYGNEEEFTRLLLEEVQPADVLYDIGACVGLVTVHAARKGAHVVAFEPDRDYRSRLVTNLRLNGLTDVQVVEWAVSDTGGEATLFTDGVQGRSPSLREIGERGSVNVCTDSIDNAIERGEIPEPDVVKMDIEGAEVLALYGMRDMLASKRAPRVFFIEIHPGFLPAFDSSSEEIQSILESFGYYEEQRMVRDAQVHCVYRKKERM